MWVIPGKPIFGVAVPLWLVAGNVPPAFDGEPISFLNNLIQKI
jgi:hypothetical protein